MPLHADRNLESHESEIKYCNTCKIYVEYYVYNNARDAIHARLPETPKE